MLDTKLILNDIRNRISQNDVNGIRSIVNTIQAPDILLIIYNLSTAQQSIFFRSIYDIMPSDILLLLCDHEVKSTFIETIGFEKVANIITTIDIEDIIQFLDTLNAETQKGIIELCTPDVKTTYLSRMQYDKDAVGRIMQKSYFTFLAHWTIDHVIAHIKNYDEHKRHYFGIIINSNLNPIGILEISNLLYCTDHNAVITSVSNQHFIPISPTNSIGELVQIFRLNKLNIAPVVNKKGKIIGTISVNQVWQLMQDETEEDVLSINDANQSSILDRIGRIISERFPWLFINLSTACITLSISNLFDDILHQSEIAYCMLLISTTIGTNTAMQSMSVTIRALRKYQINRRNMFSKILAEVFNAGINGFILAILSYAICLSMYDFYDIALVFSSAIIINCIIAGIFGSIVPIILKFHNIDPTTPSGILTSIFTDNIGLAVSLLLIYLMLM